MKLKTFGPFTGNNNKRFKFGFGIAVQSIAYKKYGLQIGFGLWLLSIEF